MNTLKIVVFGRGCGEALLCQLDSNEWLAIDSFLDPQTKEPIALTYLKNNNIDPKLVLTKVMLTHFHEDHILGSDKLVEAASDNVKVYVPQAMTIEETKRFFGEQRLYTGYQKDNKLESFMAIIRHLFEKQTKTIQLKQDSAVHLSHKLSIHALSPSEHDSQASLQKFLKLIGDIEERSRLSVSKDHANSFSVSLHARYNTIERSAILAGDLETCKSNNGGWISALDSEAAPNSNVELIKVAHHGSETGYHKEFWDNHVTNDSHAIFTTYDNSRNGGLPTEKMVELFNTHTENTSCTTTPKFLKEDPKKHQFQQLKKKYGHTIAKKMIEQLGNRISAVNDHGYGYIEASFDLDTGKITVNKFKNAVPL